MSLSSAPYCVLLSVFLVVTLVNVSLLCIILLTNYMIVSLLRTYITYKLLANVSCITFHIHITLYLFRTLSPTS